MKSKSFSATLHKIQLAVLVLLVTLMLAACSDSAATPTTGTTTGAASTGVTAEVSPNMSTGQPTAEATFAPASSNQTTAAAAATAPASTPIAVKDGSLKTNLTIWSALSGNQNQLLNDQVKQFMKAYPGVKINVVQYNSDEIGAEFQTATQAGNAPDLVLATSDYVSDFTTEKLVQPVDSLLDPKAYAANALGASNLAGSQYGVPYIYGNTLVLLYNKNLVPTPPTDTDQLVQMAQDVAKPSKDRKTRIQGLVTDLNEPYELAPWIYGFGGSLLDSSGQPSLNSAGVTQALQFFSDLGSKDKIADPNYEPSQNRADYMFRDGLLAFYITTDQNAMNYAAVGAGGTPPANPNKQVEGVGLDLGVAPLPKVSATGKNATPFTNSEAFFVSSKTSGDKLTAAKDFLAYVATPEQQVYMATQYHLLPPTNTGLASDAVKNSVAMSGIAAQLSQAIPQPSQPQMKAVWDALRPGLEQVVAGVVKPQDAAQQMQQAAQSELTTLGLTQP